MRKAIVVLLAGALLASCTASPQESNDGTAQETRVELDTPELRKAKKQAGIEDCTPAKADPSDSLPDVTLACLGGGPDVDLSRLRGPMVVNLFAQWCDPCREELPYFQELHERADGKVDVLGIDYLDTQPAAALELADYTGVTYPLLADPDGDVRVPLKVRGMPGTAFVDADGTLVAVEYTVVESYDQLADLVEEHLGVTV